ncbi:MAG: IS4 family transposase, partial [Hydrogenophilaceae bacterium]
ACVQDRSPITQSLPSWPSRQANCSVTTLRRVIAVGGVLSLSSLACSLNSNAHFKHRLKSVDRLLGNPALHAARIGLYAALARQWLSGIKQVLVVVDWSDLTTDQRWHLLRASVVVEGRSLTLYEEVHPQKRYGHPTVHHLFLCRLSRVLPAGCRPIVMTDGGFHASWFKLVSKRGWAFVGRLRGRDLVRQGEGDWTSIKSLHSLALPTSRDLGRYQYVRSNPIDVRLVLSQRPARGRHRMNIYGRPRTGRSSAKNALSAKEPWLLATSLDLDHLAPDSVVSLYAQRMRIEQSFRDTKNLRVGQGLESARSRSRERWQMLLLIAHLGAFVQRLIGEAAKASQLELNFMATRRQTRAEISVITLGRRILNAPAQWLHRLQPGASIHAIRLQAANACCFGRP